MIRDNEKIAFKLAVKKACLHLLQQRVAHAKLAMEEAQAGANSQDKSSAGDKYETARAMGQLDRNMNAIQLLQAQEEYRLLESMPAEVLHRYVVPGTIIELGTETLFAAVGLGNLVVNNRSVTAISCKSPLFQQLKTKSPGDGITFRDKKIQIADVY